MKSESKLFWFLAISFCTIFLIISGTAILLWHSLTPLEKATLIDSLKQNLGYLFIAAVLLFAVAAFAFDAVIHLYLIPLRRLAEQTGLLHTVNPDHRISIEGSVEINQLVVNINRMADRFERSRRDVELRVVKARSEVEQEKNILAAIMAELPQGVVVCNADGNILLYNKSSRALLKARPSKTDEQPANRSFIGLGRSIFSLIDPYLLNFALGEIRDKLRHGRSHVVSYFVLLNSEDQLLRVEAAPILDVDRKLTGFILILRDITQQLDADHQVRLVLDNLSKGLRSSLTNIRATIETMLNYPDMKPEQLVTFQKIIHDESISLGAVLDNAAVHGTDAMQSQWPLMRISVTDLLSAIKKKAAIQLDAVVDAEYDDPELTATVDVYSFVLSVLFVLNYIKSLTGEKTFQCLMYSKDRRIHLDLQWTGAALKLEQLRGLLAQSPVVESERIPFTLETVLGHHAAEIWPYSCDQTHSRSCLRFFLPRGKPMLHHVPRDITVLPESRPEFYDFDLFNQPGQLPELDNRSLTELTYTVFDTETTGLNPDAGDEILSIGAVRIVNGRLLGDERFDQLVDPRREIPQKSINIHGIRPEMLIAAPTIDQVLPRFARFVEETILIAHNAAFDMRLLQIKERQCGIRFTNPVLDTFLLSAVVHPNQENHNLETIARYLGVTIENRHTAIGDAVATAEIFLKLLPLLNNRGIFTLGEAREACRGVYQARRKY